MRLAVVKTEESTLGPLGTAAAVARQPGSHPDIWQLSLTHQRFADVVTELRRGRRPPSRRSVKCLVVTPMPVDKSPFLGAHHPATALSFWPLSEDTAQILRLNWTANSFSAPFTQGRTDPDALCARYPRPWGYSQPMPSGKHCRTWHLRMSPPSGGGTYPRRVHQLLAGCSHLTL